MSSLPVDRVSPATRLDAILRPPAESQRDVGDSFDRHFTTEPSSGASATRETDEPATPPDDRSSDRQPVSAVDSRDSSSESQNDSSDSDESNQQPQSDDESATRDESTDPIAVADNESPSDQEVASDETVVAEGRETQPVVDAELTEVVVAVVKESEADQQPQNESDADEKAKSAQATSAKPHPQAHAGGREVAPETETALTLESAENANTITERIEAIVGEAGDGETAADQHQQNSSEEGSVPGPRSQDAEVSGSVELERLDGQESQQQQHSADDEASRQQRQEAVLASDQADADGQDSAPRNRSHQPHTKDRSGDTASPQSTVQTTSEGAQAALAEAVAVDEASSDETAHAQSTAPQTNGEGDAAGSTTNVNSAATAAAPGQAKWTQQLISRGNPENPSNVQLQDADHARFVNRVARAFQAVGEEGGEIRLRLSPPELGSLRLQVKVQGGVLSAHIEADTPQARSVLLDNLPILRQRLAEQNIRVDQFDVDLTDRHPGGAPDGTPHERDRQPHQTVETPHSQGGETPPSESAATENQQNSPGHLNVVV